ncbi:MAG: hypothetical protein AAF297_11335 [Planctomycetota bacterium]
MMFPRADLRLRHAAMAAAGLALGAVAFSMSGCGEEEPPPPPPPPPRTAPPPPPPDRVATEAFLEFESAHEAVQFPASAAPYDPSLARAIIAFASALAGGDDLAISEMLDPTGRAVLDQLVSSGEWFEVADAIETVRVVYLTQTPDETTNAGSARFVLAIKEQGDDAYVLGWDTARASGDTWAFAAFETTGQTRATASAWDSDSSGDFLPGGASIPARMDDNAEDEEGGAGG